MNVVADRVTILDLPIAICYLYIYIYIFFFFFPGRHQNYRRLLLVVVFFFFRGEGAGRFLEKPEIEPATQGE